MSTPDELRAAIAAARFDFRSALAEAGSRWEQGEDAEWTPRKIAAHAIGADVFFASEVCKACGYPGLDPFPADCGTADEAIQKLDEAAAKSDGRLKYVSETDLGMKHERFGPVEAILQLTASHLLEHATQIRAS